MKLTQFLQKTAEFYFGNPDAIPLMLVLYMLPILVILALGYSSLWITERIGKKLGYQTKRERELEAAFSQGLKKGKEMQKAEDRQTFADEYYSKGFSEGCKYQINLLNEKRSKYKQDREKKEAQEKEYQLFLDEEKKKQVEYDHQNRQQSKHIAGEKFELAVKSQLESYFHDRVQNGQMRILHNIEQPGELDFQIDLVVIDISGIYVIECKRWSGVLVGGGHWTNWVQISFDEDFKSPSFYCYTNVNGDKILDNARLYYNPMLQVRSQTDKLAKLITVKHGYRIANRYKRMVVMHNDSCCDFLDPTYKGPFADYTWFGKESELIESIEHYQQGCNYLTVAQVAEIYKILHQYEFGAKYINALT